MEELLLLLFSNSCTFFLIADLNINKVLHGTLYEAEAKAKYEETDPYAV
jgi:hypothetical protein